MKTISITATYRRPDITRATLEILGECINVSERILVGSDADDMEVANKTGARFILYKNKPLGEKWLAGVLAAKELKPDAIMICGSDDWLTPGYIKDTIAEIKTGYDVAGCAFWNAVQLKENGEHDIYNCRYAIRSDPVGSGKIISARILDKIDWYLFPEEANCNLDYFSSMKLQLAEAKLKVVEIPLGVFCIKHDWPCMNNIDGYIKSDMVKARKIENIIGEVFPGKIEALFKSIKERNAGCSIHNS